MNRELIHCTALTKKFGKIIAISDLEMRVYPGITGLIGPNGSGKTTTINILAGLVYPDHGEATILGLDPLHEKNKLVGQATFLLENISLPNHLTVEEYLERVMLRFSSISKEDYKRILEEIGIYDIRRRKIRTLSAGMKQKLLIAQCLLPNPEIIILDEPITNLDPISRINILSIIKEMWKKNGTSILLSTHILPILEDVVDNIIFLKDGEKIAEGQYTKLVEEYLKDYIIIELETTEVDTVIHILDNNSNVELLKIDGRKITFKINEDHREFTKRFFKEIVENEVFLEKYVVKKPSLDELYQLLIDSERYYI